LGLIDISAALKGFAVDQYPNVDGLKEIASQLNYPDPDFYFELHVRKCMHLIKTHMGILL
jgi:hypothetical protein